MAYAISPNFLDTNFPSVWSLDQKIEVFADRVKGWQLDMAKLCEASSPHAGFAVLSIVFSYFEMIAKYQDGYLKNDKPKKYFKKGFKNVFKYLSNKSNDLKERLLEKIYCDVRCGLYHAGITGPNIELSGDFTHTIFFLSPPDKVQINPYRIVIDLEQHFQLYVDQLRDSKNTDLRKNFEKRFDYRRINT